MEVGRIKQVLGAVVDVEFRDAAGDVAVRCRDEPAESGLSGEHVNWNALRCGGELEEPSVSGELHFRR